MRTAKGKFHKYLVDLNLSQAVERRFFFMGYHHERDLQLAIDAIVKPGDTFIDVGANLGFVTLHAARRVGPSGRVIAFEPQAVCCDRIRRNMSLNNIKHIDIHNFGLSDRASVLTLTVLSNVSALATFTWDDERDGPNAGGKVDVPVARGDDIVRDRIIGNLMMKIDVEGFELFVLRGFAETIKKHRPPIFQEVVPLFLRRAGVGVADVFDWYRAMDYRGYAVSLTGKWKNEKLRLRPIAAPDDPDQAGEVIDKSVLNVLWLPANGSRFDPAPCFK
jgi:FkbM family methyltransferase